MESFGVKNNDGGTVLAGSVAFHFRDIRSDFPTPAGYRAGRHGLRSDVAREWGDKTAQGPCELNGGQLPDSPPGKVELDRFRRSTTPAFLSPPQSLCRCFVRLPGDNL